MYAILKRKYINLVTDKKFSEILTGSAWALPARLLATALNFISSIIIARFYGADVVGIVAVINAFLMLASIATALGTPTSILRLIPEHIVQYSYSSAYRIYRKVIYLVFGASIVASFFLYISSNWVAEEIFSKPHLGKYIAMASVFIFFKSIILVNTESIRGIKFIRIFALMLILQQSINIVLLIILRVITVSQDIPIVALLLSYGLTGIFGLIVMEFGFKKKKKTNDLIYDTSYVKIFDLSIPMLVATGMDVIITQAGIIILGVFWTETEVGYFSIAFKLASLTIFPLGAINSMAAPKFSELYHTKKISELFHVAKKSSKLIFVISTPILLGFVIFGNLFLKYMFGHEYSTAYVALFLLVVGYYISSICGSTGIFMNMTGNQVGFRNIMSVATIINILLNFLLIPQYGINGAAFTLMTTVVFWNINVLIFIKRRFGETIGYCPGF